MAPKWSREHSHCANKNSRSSISAACKFSLVVSCDSGLLSSTQRPIMYLLLLLFDLPILPICNVCLGGILFASSKSLLPSSHGLPSLATKYTILSLRYWSYSLVSIMLNVYAVSDATSVFD